MISNLISHCLSIGHPIYFHVHLQYTFIRTKNGHISQTNLVCGFNPSEKYESQLGRIIPYIMENNKCLKPPTSNVKCMKITSGKWLKDRPWGVKKTSLGRAGMGETSHPEKK